MIVSPTEAAKNTVLMKDSSYSHNKMNKQSKKPSFSSGHLKSTKDVQKTAGRLAG